MSESFHETQQRLWQTHGRVRPQDYRLPFLPHVKQMWRGLKAWHLQSHKRLLAHWYMSGIDPIKYQDCMRRRNEWLDIGLAPREPEPNATIPAWVDLKPYAKQLDEITKETDDRE